MGFHVEERFGGVVPSPYLDLLVLAILIGSLTYCLHRVLLNPIFYRVALLFAELDKWSDLKDPWLLLFWWPRQREIDVSAARHGSLDKRDYFVGWSAEVHLVYQVAEMSLFCVFIWPGWSKETQWWWWAAPSVLIVFNIFWHVTELCVELKSRALRQNRQQTRSEIKV